VAGFAFYRRLSSQARRRIHEANPDWPSARIGAEVDRQRVAWRDWDELHGARLRLWWGLTYESDLATAGVSVAEYVRGEIVEPPGRERVCMIIRDEVEG
jgi:hypothetical protein